MKSLTHPLTPEFTFAGFTFPKHVWTLPKGKLAKRIEQARNPVCGPYYHSPPPRVPFEDYSTGFYLESDGMPGLRWKFADEIIRLNHKGWYCDEFQDSTIRGIVFTLPKSRGFLAGWTMGKEMSSAIECSVLDTEKDAARVADSLAEHAARRQREFEEEERAKEEAAEAARLEEFAEEFA